MCVNEIARAKSINTYTLLSLLFFRVFCWKRKKQHQWKRYDINAKASVTVNMIKYTGCHHARVIFVPFGVWRPQKNTVWKHFFTIHVSPRRVGHPIIQMTICVYHVIRIRRRSIDIWKRRIGSPSLSAAVAFRFHMRKHIRFLWFSFSEYNYCNQFLSFNSNDQWEFEIETHFFHSFQSKEENHTTWNIFERKGRSTGNSPKRETKWGKKLYISEQKSKIEMKWA